MLEKFKSLNELSSMLLAHIEESGIAISDSDKRFGPGYFGFVAMVAQAIKHIKTLCSYIKSNLH